MTLDKLVTADLVALSAVAKQRPVAFDKTLRAVGIIRDARREDAGSPAVLAVCRVFAHRVARASAGAAALAVVGGLLVVVMSVAFGEAHDYGHGVVTSSAALDGWYAWHSLATWAVAMPTLVALAYFAGYAAGAWRFHRAVRERKTEALLRRADASSVWLPIAGATSIAVVLGALWLTIGNAPVGVAWRAPWSAIVAAAIAVAVAIVGAAGVGRAITRGRGVALLAHRGVVELGVLLGVIAASIAFRFDDGPVMAYWQGAVGRDPSTALRVGLVVVWALAAFLVSTGIVVRRRVAVDPSAVDGLAVVGLCRVFAHRIARAAAGVASLAFVGAMLAALAFGFPEVRLRFWQGVAFMDFDRARWYLHHDAVAWAGSMIVAVAMIYFAAFGLAARRFERAVAGANEPEALGRSLVCRVDGRSLALAIAGTTTLAVVLGSMWLTIGGTPLAEANPEIVPSVASWFHQAVVAIACTAVAATAVGWAVGGGRLAALAHPATIGAGVLFGIVTLCVGFELDVGQLYNAGAIGVGGPSLALRGALMVAGTVAVFVVVTGLALRRRRREARSTEA